MRALILTVVLAAALARPAEKERVDVEELQPAVRKNMEEPAMRTSLDAEELRHIEEHQQAQERTLAEGGHIVEAAPASEGRFLGAGLGVQLGPVGAGLNAGFGHGGFGFNGAAGYGPGQFAPYGSYDQFSQYYATPQSRSIGAGLGLQLGPVGLGGNLGFGHGGFGFNGAAGYGPGQFAQYGTYDQYSQYYRPQYIGPWVPPQGRTVAVGVGGSLGPLGAGASLGLGHGQLGVAGGLGLQGGYGDYGRPGHYQQYWAGPARPLWYNTNQLVGAY